MFIIWGCDWVIDEGLDKLGEKVDEIYESYLCWRGENIGDGGGYKTDMCLGLGQCYKYMKLYPLCVWIGFYHLY